MSFTRCKLLLQWYQVHARSLPWRETDEPYKIWISEIMLQQTQVKTVLPRFEAWFKHFPTVEILSKVTLDDVLKVWEGLGYYRRARFIHQAAQRIVTEHGGCFPSTFTEIMALPGIGRSTAGAIASFCFGAGTPVLDGNVKRVLKRWHAKPDASDKQLWLLAQQAIDASGESLIWNQAMMELGATLCSARSADCARCPVNADCDSAFRVAYVTESRKRVKVRNIHWQVHLHTCPQKGIWLIRRPDAGIWAGLWTPPVTELENAPDSVPAHIHQLTHRRIHLYPLLSDQNPQGEGRWVQSIEGYALPTGIHRLLEKVVL